MDYNKQFNESEKTYWEAKAKLQKKKNSLRKALNEKGVQPRKGKNDFDNYKYFSEAQYKNLFTELFSNAGIEFHATTIKVEKYEGGGKMPYGRSVTLECSLIDCDTGFTETSIVMGEGMDKGDKGIYKAYTGAIKYFLANTFMVSTGDDVEKESPDGSKKPELPEGYEDPQISPDKAKILKQACEDADKDVAKLCKYYKVASIDALTVSQFAAAMKQIEKENKKKEAAKKEFATEPQDLGL